jgi:hypothetical protein
MPLLWETKNARRSCENESACCEASAPVHLSNRKLALCPRVLLNPRQVTIAASGVIIRSRHLTRLSSLLTNERNSINR